VLTPGSKTEQAWCEVAPGSLILKEIALKEKAGLVKAGLVLALVSLLAGCVGQPRPAAPPATAAGPQLSRPRQIPDDDLVLTWGTGERFLVVVEKSCRRLKVYSHGRLLKSYPAVFGRRKGRKIHEGDKRTPTGLYMIVDKRPHDRWAGFLLVDYPNDLDMRTYWRSLANGDIPRNGRRYVGMGGLIGIHGTDREELNRAGIDWTLGCVSLATRDARELYAMVPEGTLVYIAD